MSEETAKTTKVTGKCSFILTSGPRKGTECLKSSSKCLDEKFYCGSLTDASAHITKMTLKAGLASEVVPKVKKDAKKIQSDNDDIVSKLRKVQRDVVNAMPFKDSKELYLIIEYDMIINENTNLIVGYYNRETDVVEKVNHENKRLVEYLGLCVDEDALLLNEYDDDEMLPELSDIDSDEVDSSEDETEE